MGETYALYDPANAMVGSYYENQSAGIDFGGWGQTLQDIAKIGASTWSQTALMQQNQQGQRYIEGQRLSLLNSGVGGISLPTLLLVGGGILVFMLMKG